LDRIIDEDIRIVQMQLLTFMEVIAEQFYEDHVGKVFFPTLENYVTFDLVLALILAGAGAS
jgi:nucleoside diphosphate kinase